MDIYKIYLLFWILAILGWFVEVIFCSIADRKFVNRGFLIGPYLPIYGFGGLFMLLFIPYTNHPLIVFVLSLFICSVIEYIASYIMEKLFKVRWWDYSDDSFNINGRICLRNAIAFGALGVIYTKYLYSFIMLLLDRLTINTMIIIDIFILIVTLIDIIVSFKAMNSIKDIINKNINNLKNIDATSDIKKIIHDKFNYNYLQKRLIDTYHLIESDAKKIYQKLDNKNYQILIVFCIIGLIMGIVFSYIYHKYSYIILFISISILMSFIIKGKVKK